jgi:flagellar protein FliS
MNNGYAAYQNSKIMTASPAELTLMLYEGAIKFCNIAIMGIEENNIQKAHTNIVKVENIIEEFQATLNHKYPVAKDFENVYKYLQERLVEANMKKDKEILEEVLVHLRTMRDTWKEVMKLAHSYIEILKQSLTKKIELLDTIMALNVLQKDMLENPDLDPDELEENLNRKADLVEQLSKLDDGFSQIYDRVRADLTENRGAYSEDIAQMKRDITAIMDKSTAIQSQEKRNQVLMQQKFTSVKKQIKEVKKSRQAVNSYYRNMMKMGTPGSTFLDDKK